MYIYICMYTFSQVWHKFDVLNTKECERRTLTTREQSTVLTNE